MRLENRFIKASAGTGKTYTIVNDVAEMVGTGHIPLEKILIVTYTEKAVGELKERIRDALGKKGIDSDDAQIYTIHSFCQRVLEDYAILAGQPSELELIDNTEIQSFVDKWIREELPKIAGGRDCLEKYKDGINSAINRIRTDLTKGLELYDSSFSEIHPSDSITILTETLLKDLNSKWQAEKENRKVQTYNDMIRFVRDKVIEDNSKLTDVLRDAYRCAIIDEFQDTNGYQWDIFQRIFLDAHDDEHFLYVVGDEKQSIYGFQGADLNVYLKAEKKYTDDLKVKVDPLKENWRSSKAMIEACNDLFNGEFFKDSDIGYSNSVFPESQKYNKPLVLCGKEISPFWFYSQASQDYDSFCDEYEFADFVVNRIRFCCCLSSDGRTTNLQIPKLRAKEAEDPKDYAKDPSKWEYRNAEFGDFAVLARTKSEMGPIESALRKHSIPYTRYKDKNLFNSMECQHWISLLNAIDSDDFTGKNKSILTEALFTKFFSDDERKQISSIDSPSNPLRQRVHKWHELAEKRIWANLIESIFEESNIEQRLTSEKKYLSISIFRQIGMTVLEMLYEDASSIVDVIHDLTVKMSQVPDEGDLVEKGTDRKTVQIMTIHAAKGLEFPVVIPVVGFKGRFTQIPHVYTYYDEKKKKVLSFDKNDDTRYWDSFKEELKRLYYVAFTRAKYLMIIPRYPSPKKNAEDTEFIRNAIKGYIEKHKDEERFARAEEFFGTWNGESTEKESGPSESESSIVLESIANTRNLLTSKHSYSSLSNRKEKNDDSLTVANTDSANDTEDENSDTDDSEGIQPENKSSQVNPNPLSEKYPKGSKAGNAVHTIFELSDFQEFGKKPGYDELFNDDSFKQLVHDSFWKESYSIGEDDSLNIRKQTASYVWNTLNAKLPIIVGGEKDGRGFFQLKELKQEDRLAEIEFHLDAETDETELRHYCMGFIDLLFKHEVDGKQVFSILDWKTDTKLDGKQIDYSDEKEVKAVIDSEYRIQRTLYSYCLIKWLLQFRIYGTTPQEVFDNYFGGIYYVLIRGCKAGTGESIYSQTWETWEDLESEYSEIIKSQMQ